MASLANSSCISSWTLRRVLNFVNFLEIVSAESFRPPRLPMQADIIILLQQTSPLRPKGSLETAINKFIDGNYDSFLSLSPTHNFFWSITDDFAKAQYDFNNRPRRQDITESDINYIENGSIYIFTTTHFTSTKNRLGGKIGYIIFEEEFSHEVDTPQDLKILEQISRDLINN